MDSYKQVKVDFVSGHNGTSFSEISLVASFPIILFLLRHVIVICYPLWNSFLSDFAIMFVPVVFSMTVLSGKLVGMYAFVLGLTVLVVVVKFVSLLRQGYLQWRWVDTHQSCWNVLHMPVPSPLPFVTEMRVTIMILTIVAILAVDFPAFPRRFAKAETFGVGLMDVGVGLFVVSYGLVSAEARSAISKKLEWDWHWNLSKNWKSTIPLVGLGFVRLLTTISVDYHVHVSEYGAHWNFFFTLAAVKLLCSVLEPLSTIIPCRYFYGFVSIMTIGAYQGALTRGGWTQYLLGGLKGDGSRGNLLDANREGVLSCIGFIALYLAGIQLGKIIFQSRLIVKSWVSVGLRIACVTGMTWTLAVACHLYVQPVSRRFANLSFYLWIVSVEMTGILFYMCVDLIVLLLSHHLVLRRPVGLYEHPSRTFYSVHVISKSADLDILACADVSSQVWEIHRDVSKESSQQDLSESSEVSSRENSQSPRETPSQSSKISVTQRRNTWQSSKHLFHDRVVEDIDTIPTTRSNSLFTFDKVNSHRHSSPNSHSNRERSPCYLQYSKESKPSSFSCLISAVGQNQLFCFLLGNILTGLVNMTFDTIHTGNVMCVCILILYLFVLCLLFNTAYRLGIKTKMW